LHRFNLLILRHNIDIGIFPIKSPIKLVGCFVVDAKAGSWFAVIGLVPKAVQLKTAGTGPEQTPQERRAR
jgi:hypothetical protein